MNGIDRQLITGIVLAGGRGGRMGGLDKGLQNYQGVPLGLHVLLRLQPQVGDAMISANRNLGAYESMGVPVWPDGQAGFAGPLAGVLVGLERCETPYLATVPCDTPHLPLDLVERLARALTAEDADVAVAAIRTGGETKTQPLCSLLKATLLESLMGYQQEGGGTIDGWTARHRAATVVFDDAAAFDNAATLEDLRRLQG